MTRRKSRQSPPVPVNASKLAPANSYGVPDYVARGYYEDRPFICAECGAPQVWRATQQKWWYEVAKGYVDSGPKLCRACRMVERTRKLQARLAQQAGLANKRAKP